MSSGANDQVKDLQCAAFRNHGWGHAALYICQRTYTSRHRSLPVLRLAGIVHYQRLCGLDALEVTAVLLHGRSQGLFYPRGEIAEYVVIVIIASFMATQGFCKLENNGLVFSILSRDCQALESVQILAVKFVKGLRRVPCETALQRLQLFSLVRRRSRGYLICMYEIMHGLLDFPCDAVFAAPTRIGLRGHSNAFSVRVVPYWNKLPEDIVNATSVETFKFRLDARWQKFPSNPSPNTPSRICSTMSYPTLCYWCNYSWSSIEVFTAH